MHLTGKKKKNVSLYFATLVARILLYFWSYPSICTPAGNIEHISKEKELKHLEIRKCLSQRWHYHQEGVRGVMVIVVGNGHGDTSSNLGRD